MLTYAKRITFEKRLELAEKISGILYFHYECYNIEKLMKIGFEDEIKVSPICCEFIYDSVVYRYEGWMTDRNTYMHHVYRDNKPARITVIEEILMELDEAISFYINKGH